MGVDEPQAELVGGLDSQQLFVRLFVAHQRRIHAFIRILVPNSTDADDVLQETSITGLGKFAGSFLRDRCNASEIGSNEFMAWICTIARYEALKNGRNRRRGQLLFSEALTDELASAYAMQLEYLEFRNDALADCLAKLSPRDREVLLCRYEANLSGPEISARLGRPINTIYKTLQRVRQALLECVNRTLRAQGHQL